ncbi:MAG TPA: hypothetical protein VGJ66_20830 [Pyrinomonadaceae bacterium]
MTFQQWKPGLFVALILAIITSLPQLYLSYKRGTEWNGAYASFDTDEFAYSAYVNALINGRPRRSDPYTGNDRGQFETLFSIQFIPAYSIAIPARMLSISASTAFILLVPLITVGSALILFLLLFEITGKPLLGAFGVLVVLCFGAFAYSAPWIFFSPRLAFPFLRRYMPGFSFPFFLAMAVFVWRSLEKDSLIWPFLAGLSLLVLIFSYFFLWTAAAVWLAVLMILWLIARPHERVTTLKVFGVIGLMALAGLIPYVFLLRARSPIIDQAVSLELTHFPDLIRGPEIYGAVILLGLIRQDWRQPRTLFTLSFALAPFVLFNQQVITGHSLQPFHYEQFIANYWILIGLCLSFGDRWNISKRIISYLWIVAIGLGLSYGALVSVSRFKTNAEVDKGRAAALRLHGNGVVFAPNLHVINSIPTSSSNPVLWARHSFTFSNVNLKEQKHRYYQYLYYSSVTADELRLSLTEEHGNARVEIFGADRANPVLTGNSQPITQQDVETALDEYRLFCSGFSLTEAAEPLLSYAVVSATENLTNLDKWYERDSGERVGDYTLFHLKLRP